MILRLTNRENADQSQRSVCKGGGAGVEIQLIYPHPKLILYQAEHKVNV